MTLTPVTGDPFNEGAQYQLTPVDGDPFQQNMALTDYARTLPAGQPPIGQPGGAPLDDFAPTQMTSAVPTPAIPALADVAGDPSRSLAVRLPAAIGSSLADQGRGLVQSAWGAATLPGDVARGLVDPNSPEAIRRSTDLAGLLTLPNGAEPQLAPEVMAPRAGENISSAAIKAADGRIFTGHTHADAYEQAMKAGIDIADIDAVGFDGFLTSSGRYVDRPTALRIASSQQQFAPEEGQYGLRAEQLGQKSLAGTATDSGNTMYAGGEGGRPLALAELASQRDQAIPIPSSPGGPQLSLTPVDHDPFAGTTASSPAISDLKNDNSVMWHGSISGDLRGGQTGLHVGSYDAAKQALEARIGVPASGEWDGTRKYGETLLAGKDTLAAIDPRGYNVTGYNVDAPKSDYYPTKQLTYPDGTPVPMDLTPSIKPYKITGSMNNAPSSPYEDFKANGYMQGALKRGNAKNGYYYNNVGEDAGSISAVVPSGGHLTPVPYQGPSPPVTPTPQPTPPSITAYHGNPHSFDQFDLSKIGTGEGAQAYGHGLYFASAEGVAQQYKKALSNHQWFLDGQPIPQSDRMQGAGAAIPSPADMKAAGFDGSRDQLSALGYLSTRDNLDEAISKLRDGFGKPDRASYLESLRQRLSVRPGGSMYQVAINADPEHFLDWDKPLSEQHPVVHSALTEFGAGHDSEIGGDAYYKMMTKLYDATPESAAQHLRDRGVPGIKYLDAGSRSAGDGSRNYVVFSPENLAILKKYGLAGLGLGAGGAALTGQPQPAQAAGVTLTPVQGNPFAGAQ